MALEAVTYDEATQRLRATYRVSRETVVFDGVPQEIYDSLIFAESISAYFQDHIEGRFPAERVAGARHLGAAAK